jgi:hypothetical protein
MVEHDLEQQQRSTSETLALSFFYDGVSRLCLVPQIHITFLALARIYSLHTLLSKLQNQLVSSRNSEITASSS